MIKYEVTNLRPLPAAQALRKLLDTSLNHDHDTSRHRKQILTILKTVLSETLQNILPEERFVRMSDLSDEILDKVNNNYQVFISGFSFEKAREELEERKMEYMVKLNGVLSDIQNKFLAVPLALLLAGGQLEDKNGFTWKNCSIMVGSLIFGCMMLVLVYNQRHTLHSVWEEMRQRRDRYKNQHPTLFEKVEDIFSGLEKRYNSNLRILKYLIFSTWLGMTLTAWVFSDLTFQASVQLKSLYCTLSEYIADFPTTSQFLLP